jgi:large subunit ribosomal protein L25
MEQFVISAERREEIGTGAARKCRREGRTPGVVYGHGQEVVNLMVDSKELAPLLRHRGSMVIDLNIPGLAKGKDIAALLKEVQRDPVSRQVLSVDFQWISLKEAVTVAVPVAVVGKSPGVEQENGVLEQILHEVTVSCLPTAIPERLEADISSLTLGHSLHVSDLQAPEGVEVLTAPEETVITIARPVTAADLETRVEEEGAAEVEEIAEAAEEAKPAAEEEKAE